MKHYVELLEGGDDDAMAVEDTNATVVQKKSSGDNEDDWEEPSAENLGRLPWKEYITKALHATGETVFSTIREFIEKNHPEVLDKYNWKTFVNRYLNDYFVRRDVVINNRKYYTVWTESYSISIIYWSLASNKRQLESSTTPLREPKKLQISPQTVESSESSQLVPCFIIDCNHSQLKLTLHKKFDNYNIRSCQTHFDRWTKQTQVNYRHICS